ncbi:hypothetical protein SLS62_011219 [Diatrype stigma]|uniref:Phosphoglycerate mutase n=1 Tax=Diatrype stigma TaxID=117547 RepID=A0AAN9U6U8_9PEZI
MGRPPAYIFVVRHGKRLDAADRQWHLGSPTPYDPPLTYGGWLQSRTVGARIASILEEREAEEEAASRTDGSNGEHQKKRKKRRYRIIIHSSPFLRCVQTSVAISAGLASSSFPSILPASTGAQGTASPESNGSRASQNHYLSPVSSTQNKLAASTGLASPSHSAAASHNIHKSVLRLDSFLGEWLSPDYFEHITPPPRSTLMLATAKAELLRRENYNEFPHFHARHTPTATGHLWGAGTGSIPRMGSPLVASTTPDDSMSPSIDSLPSLNGGLSSPHNGDAAHGEYFQRRFTGHRGYTSPVPSYAISSSQPIPSGYVAHARDACVDIDYQWDSTRDHLGWGDGGMLPEEWASMHQRFRRGLKRLVEWYSTTSNPGEMVTKTHTSAATTSNTNSADHERSAVVEDSEEVEIENVVVLVSHGAGCNALVGAITQQPVLADIPMSSLTMAQRRPETDDDSYNFDYDRPLSSLDEGLVHKRANPSDKFELKLFANTDHLLSGIPRTMPPVSRSSSIAGPHGGSGGLFSGTYTSALRDVNFEGSPGESRRNSANASLGSIRRAAPQSPTPAVRPLNYARPSISIGGPGVTVGSGATNLSSHRPHRSGSAGLWQPRQERESSEAKDADTLMLLNFSHEKEAARAKRDVVEEAVEMEEAAEEQDKQERQQHITKNDRKNSAETKANPATETTAAAVETAAAAAAAAAAVAPLSQKTTVEARQDSSLSNSSTRGEEHDKFGDDVAVPRLWAGTGNGGLWGAPRPPGEAERLRDFSAAKRRWTVTSGRMGMGSPE